MAVVVLIVWATTPGVVPTARGGSASPFRLASPLWLVNVAAATAALLIVPCSCHDRGRRGGRGGGGLVAHTSSAAATAAVAARAMRIAHYASASTSPSSSSSSCATSPLSHTTPRSLRYPTGGLTTAPAPCSPAPRNPTSAIRPTTTTVAPRGAPHLARGWVSSRACSPFPWVSP